MLEFDSMQDMTLRRRTVAMVSIDIASRLGVQMVDVFIPSMGHSSRYKSSQLTMHRIRTAFGPVARQQDTLYRVVHLATDELRKERLNV